MNLLADFLGSVAQQLYLQIFRPHMPKARRVAWGLLVPPAIALVSWIETEQFSVQGLLDMSVVGFLVSAVVVELLDRRQRRIAGEVSDFYKD